MLNQEIIAELKRVSGEQFVLTREVDLLTYGYDCSFLGRVETHPPAVVVRPGNTSEVASIMRLASEHAIAVTVRSAGSGQAGGSIPLGGGIVLDMLRFDQILEYDIKNLQVFVQPGVVHARLNDLLKPHGFMFPPDPGSSKMATIGGMVANNSSGMRAVKYGTTRNYVLGLEAVLADGTVIETGGVGSRVLKSVSGYDLTQLLTGSEGTLGIITRIRLRVAPLPEAQGVIMATFDSLDNLGLTVQNIFQHGAVPSAIEVMDRVAIKAVNLSQPGIDLPEVAGMLLMEVDGSPPAVSYLAKQIADIAQPLAVAVKWTDDPNEMGKLWAGRRLVGAAGARLKKGVSRVYDGEDIGVPMSRVPEALTRIQEIAQKHNLTILTYGHVGDGNLHAAIMADFRQEAELEVARRAADELHLMALEMGGTTTAEHGVGYSRARYMEREHGSALQVMRAIKQALDPKGILNPGKMGL